MIQEYEKTHDIRFSVYRETLGNIEGTHSVILGHHDDDRVRMCSTIFAVESRFGTPRHAKKMYDSKCSISRPLTENPKRLFLTLPTPTESLTSKIRLGVVYGKFERACSLTWRKCMAMYTRISYSSDSNRNSGKISFTRTY